MLLSEFSPSRLFYIKPAGIGTAYVESLPSYIKRLAEAHSIPVGSLLTTELIPSIVEKNIKNLNFLNPDFSKKLISVIEEKTRAKSLLDLTFISLDKFIDLNYAIGNNYLTWCPLCFEDCRINNEPVYEQLCWQISFVSICKKHQVSLLCSCPYCNKYVYLLSDSSRVGHCDECGRWLGCNKITYQNQMSPGDDLAVQITNNLLDFLESLQSSNQKSYFNSNIEYIDYILKSSNFSNYNHYCHYLTKIVNKVLPTVNYNQRPLLQESICVSCNSGISLNNLFLKDLCS